MKQLEKLKSVLKEALSAPPAKMPRRWHHDDDYFDRIVVEAACGLSFVSYIVPRYKTSGLSGDEWRISSVFEQRFADGSTGNTRSFHRMRDVLKYGPYFAYTWDPGCLSLQAGCITVERKGHVLLKDFRSTFGDAVLGLGWHILTAGEGREGVEYKHLTEAQEQQHCQQVGCKETPVNFYRLKKLQVSPQHSTMEEPKYDFEGQYTWFCPRHSTRGDCGLEDADDNLVLVSGPGMSVPDQDDVSPSGLGGVVNVKIP